MKRVEKTTEKSRLSVNVHGVTEDEFLRLLPVLQDVLSVPYEGKWFTSGQLRIGDCLDIGVYCDSRMVDGVFVKEEEAKTSLTKKETDNEDDTGKV